MKKIQKSGFIFYVDTEKTTKYYSSNSSCRCYSCRNLSMQIETLSSNLIAFLAEFGIDARYPDESSDIVNDKQIDYLFVGYTVVGHIETEGSYEADIDGYHITISHGDTPYDWFPNEQTEPCFFVSVSGISLPWILDEPLPQRPRLFDKIKYLFMKKKN